MPEEHGKMKQVRFRLLFSKYIKPVTELVEIVKGIKEAQPPPPPHTPRMWNCIKIDAEIVIHAFWINCIWFRNHEILYCPHMPPHPTQPPPP